MILETKHLEEDTYSIELDGKLYLYTMKYLRSRRGSNNDIVVLNGYGDRLDIKAHELVITRLTEIVHKWREENNEN
jgi:hypothetical protein